MIEHNNRVNAEWEDGENNDSRLLLKKKNFVDGSIVHLLGKYRSVCKKGMVSLLIDILVLQCSEISK